MQRFPIARQRSGFIRTRRPEVAGSELVAVEGLAGLAVQAGTAVVEAEAHAVSLRDANHAFSDPLYETGAFMAQDGRQGGREATVTHRQIGVADAGCLDLD